MVLGYILFAFLLPINKDFPSFTEQLPLHPFAN